MTGPATTDGAQDDGPPPPDPMAAALEHFRAGRLAEAEDACRRVLERESARADALHLLGVLAHRLGRRDAAVELLGRAATLDPTNAEVHYNLGVARQFAGHLAPAAASYRESLRLEPGRVEAHNNLGYALLGLGQADEALACFRQALELRPDFAPALANRGEALLRLGQLAPAAESLRRALALSPDLVEAHNHLGVVLREQGKRDEAEACFHQALRLRPDYAGAHNNLGRVCEDRGRLDEAAARFRLALCYQPLDALGHTNLANLLLTQGKAAEALPFYRRAIELQPGEAVLHSNLSHALTLLGQPDEAEASCRTAVRLRPDLADAHNNLAIALAAQGRYAEALGANEETLRLRPDHPGARNCRALWWLQAGDYACGWPEYEWRWRIRGVSRRTFAQPQWDGSPFPGRTVLVHAEQALGDTLQFVRYVPLVKALGGTVVVECQPPILQLLRSCPGIDHLVAHGSPLPHFDFQVPLMSLPGVFGTTPASVPADVPYLTPETERVARWRRELEHLCGPGELKVGIAWQGNPNFPGDRLRSIPLAQFAPLARVPGVSLFALQKGPGRDQLRGLPFAVTDLGDRLDADGAFLDTAAVMKSLDLMVTSDSAIAHLAGALGVNVWLALPVGADWRWMIDRDDCPWYPTMRLFRQRRLYDWGEVFARMAAELGRGLSGRRAAVTVPVGAGELIDKITILEIKAERLADAARLRNVRAELAALREARDRDLPASPELEDLAARLREVNEALWRIEDDIRQCERDGDFGPRFVELARSVYRENDRRAALKRRVSELTGSEIVEEKSYAESPPAGRPAPRATVCILTYGDYLPYFLRCLDSVLQNTPAGEIELRLGFNAAPTSLEYARQRLGLAGPFEPEVLAEGVRRTAFTGPRGMTVRVWDSPVNLYKEPMARLLYHDVPLATEYAIWFDDDSFVEPGWWPALAPLLERGVDYIGQAWWVDYLPGQEEMIRSQPWFRGVPFETREGRPGIHFMTGGFVAVRSERLGEADFPDTGFGWKGDTLKQYGGDTLLGEIARQLGWTRAVHDTHVKVNVDMEGRHPAPRRGGTGRQFGSDVDVAIR